LILIEESSVTAVSIRKFYLSEVPFYDVTGY